MASAPQHVRVLEIQYRKPSPRRKSPHLVRWKIDGRPFSKSYRTKAEANRVRARLIAAQVEGERFDPDRGGLPVSWLPAVGDMLLIEWAKGWVAEQWPEWAPRTRRSAREALARFLVLAVDQRAPEPPEGIRRYLSELLVPDSMPEDPGSCAAWIERWSLSLGSLNRDVLSGVEVKLALGNEGQALAAGTAGRYRKVSKACVTRAVEILGVPASDPWPPPPKGRSRRKARRQRKSVDVKALPAPATMAAILDKIVTHQPGSKKYKVMSAAAYFAGLRPSEVVMLRLRALELPEVGWGVIHVTEADIDWDEPGEPKEGSRDVPIPSVLVGMLRRWTDAMRHCWCWSAPAICAAPDARAGMTWLLYGRGYIGHDVGGGL